MAAAAAAVLAAGFPQVHGAAGQLFVDLPDGYSLLEPNGWTRDTSLLAAEARWTQPDATLRVWSQPVKAGGAADYVAYSNRSVDGGWNGITLLDSSQFEYHGRTVWYRRWERPALEVLQPDEREYVEWDEVLSPTQVLTVMANATPGAFMDAYRAADKAWQSAQAIPASGLNAYSIPPVPARKPALVPADSSLHWGLYEPKLLPESPNLNVIHQRESQLGSKIDLILVYLSVGRPFPAKLIQEAAAEGKLVELTLQSWAPTSAADAFAPYSHGVDGLGNVLNGKDDAYFQNFAKAAAKQGLPFFFRWDNEMNGDWDPWSAFQWGKDADLYVAAWRHIHAIFQQAGATNAVWIWNPNNDNLPNYRWNAAPLYYPGNDVVDWIGLTGYNRGNASPGDVWRTFDQAYARVYQRDVSIFPGKPLLITEFGSHDAPGDKAAWITNMFASLPNYPAIRYAVWWDGNDGPAHFRLDEPPAALAAFRAGLAGSAAGPGKGGFGGLGGAGNSGNGSSGADGSSSSGGIGSGSPGGSGNGSSAVTSGGTAATPNP